MTIFTKIKAPLQFFLFCAILILLFYSSLSYLFTRWEYPDYNYCYLIPFIVIYLIWDKKNALQRTESVPDWKGLIPLLFGILLFWAGELGGEYYTLFISLWLISVGCAWLYLGWLKIKALTFPILFSLAMFPFPDFLITKFSFNLRLISSRIGVSFLQMFGLPAYREGNIIDLGFVELQVVDACSGLRYLFPLFILSLLIAYFSKLSFWKRIVLVFSTIPLSIFTNSFRIALTGIIYKLWGAELAEGFFHGFSGWLIFIFCFFVLMLEVWALAKIFPGKLSTLIKQPALKTGREPSSLKASSSKRKAQFHLFTPHFWVPIAILSISLFLSSGIEFREKTPIKKPFTDFPLTIENWTGTPQTMEQIIIESLDLSDYVIIDFHDNNHGGSINFYTAYYESQRKGESIHSPETCIPGSGWVFSNKGVKSVSYDIDSGKTIDVNVAWIQKNNEKQVVYYWFPQRGRNLTNAYQLKIYAFWDALTRQRTDGALVRLITPVRSGEKVEDAEERLGSFMGQLVPVLDEFLPN